MRDHVLSVLAIVSFLSLPPAVSTQPADSPWPMFQHDARHTGLSSFNGPAIPMLGWSYSAGATIGWSSPAVGSGGDIFFGSWDQRLYRLTSSGALLWSYQTSNRLTTSPALLSNGRAVAGDGDQRIYSINPNGSLDWSYKTGNWIDSSPAVRDDGRIYFGSEDDRLYELLPDGSFGWSYRTGNDNYASPAIGPDLPGEKGRVHVGSNDNRLYCLHPWGGLVWSYEAASNFSSSPAISVDSTVYTGNYDNNIYVIDSSGGFAWSYRTGNHVESSLAIANGGDIVVGSDDGNVYRLRSAGAFLWSYAMGAALLSSPAVDDNGWVYVNAKIFHALRSDGSLAWSYDNDAGAVSSPVIGGDGRIYVGSSNYSSPGAPKQLFCIGPTPTPTPVPNYINLQAVPDPVSIGNEVAILWTCDFGTWNYQGVPVNIYLAAIKNPKVPGAPSSVADALGGGEVWLAADRMTGWYRYEGRVDEPTWSNAAFPPVATAGMKPVAVPANPALAGNWVFATAFLYADGSGFVRTDGLPVENSNKFVIQP